MKLIRWCACFDTHGDQVDALALEAFKSFVSWWKPQIKIHGGDAWDFRWLRRSASDEEKAESVAEDFESGLDLLKWYKPDVFLWGNHDDRLRRLMDSSHGAQRELAGQWLDRISVELRDTKHYPYCKRRGVHVLKDFSFIHGYGHGMNAARDAANVYGNVVMGHTHRIDSVRVTSREDKYGYTAGCLCILDMDYTRPNMGTLRHAHGWVYGVVAGGRCIVWQARKYGNVWVLPSEIKSI
jgi:UDP-2,3-diacylglucosamine pyrophosphatase LpxH